MAARATSKEKIRSSLLKLASTKARDEIGLETIAKQAGVSIGDITSYYGSSQDILWDCVASLDEESLSTSEFSQQDSVHDKLFDLLMKRFEALQAHKSALRNMVKTDGETDATSFYVVEPIIRAMGWVLEVAGVDVTGLEGEARKRFLAWAFGNAFETFLEEDDPGLSKTMMVLDRSLSRLSVWQQRFDGGVKLVKGAGSLFGALVENLAKRTAGRQEEPRETELPIEDKKDQN